MLFTSRTLQVGLDRYLPSCSTRTISGVRVRRKYGSTYRPTVLGGSDTITITPTGIGTGSLERLELIQSKTASCQNISTHRNRPDVKLLRVIVDFTQRMIDGSSAAWVSDL